MIGLGGFQPVAVVRCCCTHTHTHTCVCICMCAYGSVHIYTYIYIYIYVCVCVCIRVVMNAALAFAREKFNKTDLCEMLFLSLGIIWSLLFASLSLSLLHTSEKGSMDKAASQLSEHDAQCMRIYRRLNDLRLQPLKSLPMTLFMMWMVGNDVSIFSIMFVGMAVMNPLQSMLGTGAVFNEFEEEAQKDAGIRSSVSQSKLIYIGCCLVAFAVALMKLSWMGLLPVNAIDWMDRTPPSYKEHSQGVFFA